MRKQCNIVALIFWTHFAVAAMSHIFVVLMSGGVVALIIGVNNLGFWVKGLMMGVTFYTSMYAVNHITNKDGFCVLTDLENFYRKQSGLPAVGVFTPRFYKKCRDIAKYLYSLVRRKSK